VLLGVMLATPAGAVASLVSPASQSGCCACCGPMCPMHDQQKSQHETMPCHGSNSSHDTCMCSSNQTGPTFIRPFAPQEVEAGYQVLVPSAVSDEREAFSERLILARSIAPPDQPPRS